MNAPRSASPAAKNSHVAAKTSAVWDLLEVLLIVVLFFVQAGSLPPDVNEAHYLVKARHFWDPQFCSGDLFCDSSDAHLAFYFTLGWLTKFMSLSAAAWCGRLICWTLLAFSWQRLCAAVAPGRFLAWISAGVAVVLWQHGHLGGEWIVGGVEAKSLAYGFVFLSLAAWTRGRFNWSLVWAGLAAALHVLVGGWTIVALGIAWLLLASERPALKAILPGLLAAFLISIPGWLPAILLSRGVDAATLAEANHIYTYERLSHHLVFHRFDHYFMLRHAALAGLLVWLWWRTSTTDPLKKLLAVCVGAVVIAFLGVVIDQTLLYSPRFASGLLRYYFFRLSDALVPVGIAFAFAAWLGREQYSAAKPSLQGNLGGGVALLLVVVHLGVVCWRRLQDPLPPAVLQTMPRPNSQPVRLWGPAAFWQTDDVPPEEAAELPVANEADQAKQNDQVADRAANGTRSVPATLATPAERAEWFQEWQQVCSWIRDNTDPAERFLTPRGQQTFKWYAQRPEVVNWKDVPQDARSLVAWHEVWNEVHPPENGQLGIAGHSDERLRDLGKKYSARFVVIDRTRATRAIGLKRVFPAFGPGTTFEVYELR